MPILFVFLDGVGLGESDAESNPLVSAVHGFEVFGGASWTLDTPTLDDSYRLFRGIDACLGIDGLPQSGTGQATLFTGINCAALAGRHFGPFPHSTSRPVLRDASVFRRVVDEGRPDMAVFANAFPPQFFAAVNRRDRWPVITRSCLDAGIRIRTLDDLTGGRAVAADVTNAGLRKHLGLDVPARSALEAASILINLAADVDLTVFEVFHTDKAGHAQSMKDASWILDNVGALLAELASIRPSDLSIVVTSDHGNVEDLTTKSHTRNAVPLAVLGPAAPCFRDVSDLTGVTPAVLEALYSKP